METDADRLSMIQSTGGQLIRHQAGEFWALFDAAFSLSTDGVVESRQPVLTARSSDVSALEKGATLDVSGVTYRINRHEPDGTGMTQLILRR